MKKLIVVGCALMALWLRADMYNDALDNQLVSFSSNDWSLPWSVVPDSEAVGGTCLANLKQSDGGDSYLYAGNITGKGTLTFRYKIGVKFIDYGFGFGYDTLGSVYFNYQPDGWSYTTSTYLSNGYEITADGMVMPKHGWNEYKQEFYTDEDHQVSWRGFAYSSAEANELAFALDNVQWTPAPTKVKVTYYQTSSSSSSWQFASGAKYADAVENSAERPGYIFGGWYLDAELKMPVDANAYIPFEGTTLYAKWYRTLAAADLAEGIKFKEDPNNPTWLVEQTYTTGKDSIYVNYPDNNGGINPINSILEFDVDDDSFISIGFALTASLFTDVLAIDGKEIELSSDYSSFPSISQTNKTDIALGKGTHKIEFSGVLFSNNGETASLEIRDVTVEKIEKQTSFGAWLQRLTKYGYWIRENLQPLANSATVTKANATLSEELRYKAALEYACETMMALYEDPIVVETLAKYGFSLDVARVNVSGQIDLSVAPPSNEVVDTAFAKIEPTARQALAALNEIPSDWSGSICISATEYPLDEDVFVDGGDILYLKAFLQAAIGVAEHIAAYNVDVDYAQVESDYADMPKVKTVLVNPSVMSDEDWDNAPGFEVAMVDWNDVPGVEPTRMDKVSLFRYGNKLYAGMKKNEQTVYWNLDITFGRISGLSSEPTLHLFAYPSNWIDFNNPTFDLNFRWALYANEEEYLNLMINDSLFSGVAVDKGKYFYIEMDLTELLDSGTVSESDLLDLCILKGKCSCARCFDFGNGGRAIGFEDFELLDLRPRTMLYNQKTVANAVRKPELLTAAKEDIRAALKLAQSADDFIVNRRQTAETCLINYDRADEAQLKVVREHVATALASLDAVQAVDWHKGVEDVDKLPDYIDYPLPVYLGGLFEGGVTRELLPNFADKAFMVPDLGSLKDPTLGGVLPSLTTKKIATAMDAKGVNYVLFGQSQGWKYSVNDNCATIERGEYSGDMTVPTMIDGFEVKAIAKDAFAGASGLKSLSFVGLPPMGLSAAGIPETTQIRYNLAYNIAWTREATAAGLTNIVGYMPGISGSTGGDIGHTVITNYVCVTVTNTVVHYVTNSELATLAKPVTDEAGLVAVIAEVKGTAVAIPESWTENYAGFKARFGNDFAKALSSKSGKIAAGGREMLVWEDYVAGTDPTKPNDKFTASMTLVDGKPVISWTPELDPARAAMRKYTTYGKVKLTDREWTVVPDGHEDDYNFFKVTVEMK